MPVLALTGAPLLATGENLLVAGCTALVPMSLGYLLVGFGLTRVPASTATGVTLGAPAVASILAFSPTGAAPSPAGLTPAGRGVAPAVPRVRPPG